MLEGANRLLHDAVFVISAGGPFVFVPGNPEQDDAADPEARALLALLHQLVDGELEVARHRVDGLADAFALHGEQRQNEIVRGKRSLANEAAQALRAAKSSRSVDGEGHTSIVAQGRLRSLRDQFDAGAA